MSPRVWIPPSTHPSEDEVDVRIRPYWPSYRNLLQLRGFRLETVADMRQYHRHAVNVTWDYYLYSFKDLNDDALCPNTGLPDNLFRGTRLCDGTKVMVKVVHRRSREFAIVRFLSTPPIRSHSMNHCIPVLDLVEEGELGFIIMEQWSPQLIPDGGPCCLKSFLSAIRQCIEHAAFMHSHRIAHLDISLRNLLTDYRGHYAYIDFELSHIFEEPNPRVSGCRLGTEIPPECDGLAAYDPFKVDVFALGVLILRACKMTGHCVPQLVEMVRPMLRDDPDQRPSLMSVLRSHENLIRKISADGLEYCFALDRIHVENQCKVE
ncbi:kinase-like protein [Marasmius fiardii PR-910]|nr:kinase-like protein [Marasmius fiardii PR-910]